MNKEEIIKCAELCIEESNCKECSFKGADCDCMENLIKDMLHCLKENEPAPAGTDTSSNNNSLSQLNDTAKLRICQEAIKDIINDLEDSKYLTDIVSVKNSNSKAVGGLKMLLNIIKSGDNK